MEDLHVVECLHAFEELYEDVPDFHFVELAVVFLVFTNFLIEISIICKFHDNTK